MKAETFTTSLVWAMLFLIVPSWTMAADFTFDVPLNLEKLHPDVKSATVHCNVASDPGVTVGEGKTSVPRGANGSIHKTVTVAFNVSPGKNPGDAKIYTCSLRIDGPNGQEGNPSTNAAAQVWRQIKPGTTSKSNAGGNL